MDISITGKNIAVTESLREYVKKKIGKLEKYFTQLLDAHVTLTVEKLDHIAETTINGDNVVFHAEVKSGDMYASIDNLFEKMEKQIRRYKEKITDKRNHSKKDEMIDSVSTLEKEEGLSIEINYADNKPMLPLEAILQLQMNRDRFLLFKRGLESVETPDEFKEHNYCVVYERKEGQFTVVENRKDGAVIHLYETKGDSMDPNTIAKVDSREFQVNQFSHEDAALTLKRLNADYYIFANSENNQLNIMYQSFNGDLGVIMPPK